MGHPIAFYTLSFLCVAGALGVVLARHPVYAVLNLVTALFALSGLFVILSAPFVAMIQILIYAGAILVLFLFVVMLLDLEPEHILRMKGKVLRLAGTLVGLFFLWQVISAARIFTSAGEKTPPVTGTTEAIGRLLFTRYALPFEAASVLLLVGVVGAVVLAKKRL